MKKTIIISFVCLAVAMFAGYNAYLSNVKTKGLSDLAKANVEALAIYEDNISTKYCTLHTKCFDYNGDETGKYRANSFIGSTCQYTIYHKHDCSNCKTPNK